QRAPVCHWQLNYGSTMIASGLISSPQLPLQNSRSWIAATPELERLAAWLKERQHEGAAALLDLREMLYDCSTSSGGSAMLLRFRITLAAVFALSFCFPHKLTSQAVYGSIVGTVQDPSGAAIAGAKVTIRNLERDVANETTTNE